MYEIEYRHSIHSTQWHKAGFELSEREAIADYHVNHDTYNSGYRRAFKVERIPVSFETVTTIKLKK